MTTHNKREEFKVWYENEKMDWSDDRDEVFKLAPDGTFYHDTIQTYYEGYQAAETQHKERIAELEKDANYIQDMFVKGYQLSYNAPVDWLTDEANKKLAWQVVRTIKPFCDAESNRAWVGSTPKEAIENCKKAIDQAIAESK